MSETFDFQIPVEDVERFFDWQLCAAFRFVRDGDRVVLEFITDLDALTAPESDRV